MFTLGQHSSVPFKSNRKEFFFFPKSILTNITLNRTQGSFTVEHLCLCLNRDSYIQGLKRRFFATATFTESLRKAESGLDLKPWWRIGGYKAKWSLLNLNRESLIERVSLLAERF